MAGGNDTRSRIILSILLCILDIAGRHCIRKDPNAVNFVADRAVNQGTYQVTCISRFVLLSSWKCRRHIGFVCYQAKGHFNLRVNRYPNSASTFQLTRLITSGDISLNPGPSMVKYTCPKCSRTVARHHRALDCSICGLKHHIKYGKVTPREYKATQRRDLMTWSCPRCVTQPALQESGPDINQMSALPFGSVSYESCLSMVESQEVTPINASYEDEECDSHLSDLIQKLANRSAKDIRVGHLNVCSLRNKIEELRCLQMFCRFEVLAITETHLDKTVPDTALDIDRMKFLRLDRKGRKGGGCILYFADHLQATHRKDLFIDGLEAIWVQVKFPSTSVLFSVMYRPPDFNLFFDLISSPLEKAWLKSSNIFLLGDFNCNLLIEGNQESDTNISNANINKLRSIFEMFNMQNVIQEAARLTITSSTLIDLIVTTRKTLSVLQVYSLWAYQTTT